MANSAFTPAVLTVSGSSSTSSGEKNYVTATDGNASGLWVASGVTVATSTSTIPDNITKASSLAITWTSGTTGYARYRFTLDQADYGKKFKIQWDQVYGTAGHWTLQVYSNTASDYTGTSTALTVQTSAVPGITGTFTTSVDMPGSTAPYIEIRVVASSTSATTIYLNSILMGPGTITQGAAISEWQSWTPTVNNAGSKGFTNTGFWRRVGSVMELKFKLTSNSTASGAGSGDFQVNLPSGYTVPSDYRYPMLAGSAETYGFIASGQFDRTVAVVADSATTLAFLKPASATYYGRSDLNVAYSTEFYAHVSVPIAEWSGSGTVSLGAGAVEYAYNTSTSTTTSDTSSFGYGPGGAQIQLITATINRRVRFQYPIQTDDVITIEVSSDQQKWFSVDAGYTDNTTYTISPYTYQAGVVYGMGMPRIVNSTDVDVKFGQYSLPGNTYGLAGSTWANASALYWRVRKAKASSPVGFGLVNANDSGLTRAYSTLTKIRLNTGNGFGSTNTTIRRFTNQVVNTGTGITYADSSTLGATFTVIEAGIYSISYSDGFNAAAAFGISLNSTQLTTSIATITAADRLCLSVTSAADYHQTVGVTLTLSVGDVIRAHASAAESANPARSQFTIQRIA